MKGRGDIQTLCRAAFCGVLFLKRSPLALAADLHGANREGQTLLTAAVFLIVAVLLAIRLLQERKIRQATAERCRKAEKLLQMQELHYRNVLARQKQLRMYRHDMVNHLMAMKNLLELGKYERLTHYIQEIRDPVTEGGALVSTGNLMVDALLSEKRAQAREEHVWLEDSILLELPQALPFVFLDLFLNFGVTHAIRTAGGLTGEKENRWVDLELSQKQGGLLGTLRYPCQEPNAEASARRVLRPLLKETMKRGGAWSLTREEHAISLEISLPTLCAGEKKRPYRWKAPQWTCREMDGPIGDDGNGEGDTL